MKYILNIICFLLLIACNNTPHKKSNILKLSPIDKNDSLFIVDLDSIHETNIQNMSSYFSEAKYIALETTDASLLGHISQIVIKGDTLFILDAGVTKQIQVFLNSGKHIGTLGNRGNGPNEYTTPTSIGIDGSNVYVYDVAKKEILFFDNQTLKYREKIKIDPNIVNRYISIIDGQIYSDAYSYKGTSPFLIQTIDKVNSHSKDQWLSTSDYALNFQDPLYFTGDVYFYKTNNGIRYYNMFGDTIMNLTKNKVQPYCAIKSRNYIKQEELNNLIELKGNDIKNFRDNIKGIYNIRYYTEWEHYIMFHLSQANFMKVVLLNKHTRYSSVTNQLYDDFTFKDSKYSLNPIPILGHGNGFYAYISSFNMENLFNLFKEKHTTEIFNNYISSKDFKEDSNPILIYYE